VTPFRLAASAEMLFLDLPFEERVRRIADLGFEVEIWDWTTKDVEALVGTGATFSSRSTTRRSRPPWSGSATPGSSHWRGGRPATRSGRSTASASLTPLPADPPTPGGR
jgi:hydroxypyruvate isomerase